jgi:ribosomal protein S18 acetylase RimI-like enzyme
MDLLGSTAVDPARALDAIVVSAFRPAENLLPAMRLAAAVGCPLVALCSGPATPGHVRRLASGFDDLRHAVVAVPAGYDHGIVDLRTNLVAPAAGGLGDLSVKRNLGLLLSHLAGWRAVLFLDDDIWGLTAAVVERAVATLPAGGAVGMPAHEFPDNSIVCHANRRTGYEQDVFVSGSALVADCTQITSFFPRIYNEDWLFMAPAVARGAVTEVGSSRQLAYEPFADPELAAVQEFGNVVADGLMTLLHEDDLGTGTLPEYWEEFLPHRQAFIGGIAARTRRDDHAVLAALAAAERRRSSLSPVELSAYVTDWQRDMVTWRDGVARLPRGLPFAEAIGRLGLTRQASISPGFDRPSGRRGSAGGILVGMSTTILGGNDWARLRDLRLAALEESPEAFLSTYDEQVGWTEQDWRAEVTRGTWLVREVGGHPVALLGATPEADIAASERYLSYLWVAPSHRRHGVARELVLEMLARLRATGVRRAWLWVLSGNRAAWQLYERLGFASTGDRQPLDKDPSRYEERMTLSLR